MTTISSDVKRYIVPENRMWDESSWKLPVLKNEQIMVLASDYDALKDERDVLAAHVERLRDAGAELVDLMDGVREGDYKPDSFTNQPMIRALAETPTTTSLAHLKAQWQAEAVSEFAFHHLGGLEQEIAEIYASKLRQQNEGGGS